METFVMPGYIFVQRKVYFFKVLNKNLMNQILTTFVTGFFLLIITSYAFDSFTAESAKGLKLDQAGRDFKIIGYVAGWRSDWTTDKIDAKKLTHINYAFADVLEDGSVVSMNENDAYNFAVLDSLKADNPNLKILISLGGWTRSTYFSDAALTKESRRTFAEKCH
jgi:chitinase